MQDIYRHKITITVPLNKKYMRRLKLKDFHIFHLSFLPVIIESDSWWRRQMETFYALLAICAGPRWIPNTKASDAELWFFFDLRLNKQLSNSLLNLFVICRVILPVNGLPFN